MKMPMEVFHYEYEKFEPGKVAIKIANFYAEKLEESYMKGVHDIAKENGFSAVIAFDKPRVVELFRKGLAFDQVAWERDVAFEQLKHYGVGLGEKTELQPVRKAHWTVLSHDYETDTYIWGCSRCEKVVGLQKPDYKYCPFCAAEMDE